MLLTCLLFSGFLLTGTATETLPGLTEKYLEYFLKYGYMNLGRAMASGLDTQLAESVKRLQKLAGLEQNGDLLDPSTLALLDKSRCGQPDTPDGTQARFAVQGSRWGKQKLSYRIVNYTPDLSKEEVDRTIQKAADMWANVSSLTFTKITDPNQDADILIKFVRGYHGDSRPADGPGKELAHAFFPLGEAEHAGDVHFDEDETWTVLDPSNKGKDLLWLAVHELGHSLGLRHVYQPESVMYPFYFGYHADLKLSGDDIAGIRALYGEAGKSVKITQPPTRPAPPPDKCQLSVDAIVTLANKKTFAFSREYVWQIHDNGHNRTATEARKINATFPGLEGNIAAAYTERSTGHTFFFKGSRYWVYDRFKYIWGPAEISEKKLPPELRDMDAALEWPRNNKVYFFKGNKYWRHNSLKNRLDRNYPRETARVWRGVPSNSLNSALLWRGRVYFFKGEEYYELNHYSIRIKPGYPRSISADWFGCQ